MHNTIMYGLTLRNRPLLEQESGVMAGDSCAPRSDTRSLNLLLPLLLGPLHGNVDRHDMDIIYSYIRDNNCLPLLIIL